VTCPCCGFDQVEEGSFDREFSVPYGPPIKATLSKDRCPNCTEEGDFSNQNDPRIERAMAESTQKSIPVMINTLIEWGGTVVYMERALRLPFGTFQKWLDAPETVEPGSVVMLRMLRRYPELLNAADNNFA
jgi:hypothetical protein